MHQFTIWVTQLPNFFHPITASNWVTQVIELKNKNTTQAQTHTNTTQTHTHAHRGMCVTPWQNR